MPLNLRDICQMAIEEISGIAVPSSFMGNPNLTAKLAVRLANRAGRHYALTYDWKALEVDYVFQTDTLAQGLYGLYDLPAGFRKFSHLTQREDVNQQPLIGPVSGAQFQALIQQGNTSFTGYRSFRLASSGPGVPPQFQMWPIPTVSGQQIRFIYYSKHWVDFDGDGYGDAEDFQDDTDYPLIDANLIALDLKWRFRKAKRLDWQIEKAEADELRDTLLTSDQGGKAPLDFTPLGIYDDFPEGNLPDTGAGL